MAYTSPVEKPRCSICGKAASVYVYNHLNARNGAYCTPHGNAYAKELSAREREV